MKILIVNASDLEGGAARAAYRLHNALLQENIDSHMLVQRKSSDDFTVIGAEGKIDKAMSRVRPLLDPLGLKFYPNKTASWFSPSLLPFSNIADKINMIDPDIVHLHWINEGMMSISDIAKIKAPIVWSLHDMWAFTGGCHYDEACGRYSENCGRCKVLASQKEKDLSRIIFNKKDKIYNKIANMTIVGLSRWIADCAQRSTLFKDRNIVNIPNPIDTDKFKPVDKITARRLLGLPEGRKLVLFGAMGATSDPRKGYVELQEAINKLEVDDMELVVIGSTKPSASTGFIYPIHFMGRLYDDVTLQLLYSAVDITVVPSLQENLSNVIMESMSCGTPVIAFDIGGNRDMIEHQTNGYLVKPFDTYDFVNGIEWILHLANYDELSMAARTKVVGNFDSCVVGKKYIELYKQVLKQ